MITVVGIVIIACKREEVNEVVKPDKYVVVFDAGHGGIDNGVYDTSYMSLPEKDIMIQLIGTLQKFNAGKDIEFKFTRELDNFISLNERVKKVNSMHPSLLVSLHATFQNDSKQNGYEIYYSQNNSNLDQSISFAKKMQTELGKSVFPGIVIKQASFHLLKNVDCPAILIETGNLRNRQLYTYLSDSLYQKTIADAIGEAVVTSLRN